MQRNCFSTTRRESAPIAARRTRPARRRSPTGHFRFLHAGRLNDQPMGTNTPMSEPAPASCANMRPLARRRFLIFGGVLLWVLSWPIVAPAAEPSQSSANAPQGWFTREQAARGRSQYRTQCASCHADNMAGNGPAPPRAGGAFLAKWSPLTVADLFERVRTTMPQNAPHSLGDSAYTDITAFLLRANNFPTGETELSADSERLRAMPLSGGVP